MKLYDSIKQNCKPLTEAMQSFITKTHTKWVKYKINKEKSREKFHSNYLFSHCYYFGDWQIISNYMSDSYCYDKRTMINVEKAIEINRWCYNVKTHKVILVSRSMNTFGYSLNYNSELKPFCRSQINAYSSKVHYVEVVGTIVPGSKLHPEITKRGFSIPFIRRHKISSVKDYIENVMKDPFKETLMKSSLWHLAICSFGEKDQKALKLCIRNKINIKKSDLYTFQDAINLMERYHVDWHNKKYLEDWRNQHDRLIAKRDMEKDEEQMKKAMTEYNQTFVEKHEGWLNIFWTDKNLDFKTLNSVKEYFEEGNIMHHCVGKCEYFKKDDVVIFSISCNGKKIATLEYDTKKNVVLQLRAKCNSTPERYDEIKSIFEEHIKQYRKTA